jgi:hypothetical protein
MSLELYRQQLVTEIELHKASFTDYSVVVEYDNRTIVDTQLQKNSFLSAEIMYIDGYQADLSNKPVHRIIGMLVLTAKTREGAGTAEGYKLLEHFYTRLQWKVVGKVRLDMAKMVRPRLLNGWWGVSATIPFHINKFPS